MSEQGKRLQRQKQSDSAYNQLLLWLAGTVVAEFVTLLLRWFILNFYRSEFGANLALGMQAFFSVFRFVGAVLVAAGCVWAFLSLKRTKKIALPVVCTGVAVWLWAASILCYSFSARGIAALCALPPVAAVLAFLYFLYQREFFLNAILSGIGIVALLVYREIYMSHPRMTYCGFAAVWLFLVAVAVLTFRLSTQKGKFRGISIFPEGSAYIPVYLTCGVVAAALLAALIFGLTFAYYVIFAVIGWLFCLAVYYTVKLM